MNWEREKGFYEISKKERAMTKIELENCSIDTDQVINFPIIIKNNFYKPITHSTYRFITSYTYRMNQESLFDPSLGLYTSFWMSNLYLQSNLPYNKAFYWSLAGLFIFLSLFLIMAIVVENQISLPNIKTSAPWRERYSASSCCNGHT